jgi:hypothetical protein
MFKSIYQGNGEQSCVKTTFKQRLELSSVERYSLLISLRLDLHQVIIVGPRQGCGTRALQLFMSVWVQGIVQVVILYLQRH